MVLHILMSHNPSFSLSMPVVLQLCSIFGWKRELFPTAYEVGQKDDGTLFLQNPSTGEVMGIPTSPDFGTGTRISSSEVVSFLLNSFLNSFPNFTYSE